MESTLNIVLLIKGYSELKVQYSGPLFPLSPSLEKLKFKVKTCQPPLIETTVWTHNLLNLVKPCSMRPKGSVMWPYMHMCIKIFTPYEYKFVL